MSISKVSIPAIIIALSVTLPGFLSAGDSGFPVAKTVEHKIEAFTPSVTSIGAAIAGGKLYVYGGNIAAAHSYSHDEQGRNLYSVNLQGGAWTKGEDGPPLQGLALVEHKGRLYRIGGFTAQNSKGEEHKLKSQAGVAVYDPTTKKWSDLAPLPEPRSSADAAVIDNTIYVVGGWDLGGGQGTSNPGKETWHKTAWKLDLTQNNPQWQAMPEPPFQRRALALAAYQGKLYAIGGMQQVGGITSRTDVFDPATGKWTEGPAILGEGRMTGFGSSAFATGGKLYVSTINGDLQRLAHDGKQWEIIAKMPTARFFHRMLPLDDKHLLVVGGGNMAEGKFEQVEIIAIP